MKCSFLLAGIFEKDSLAYRSLYGIFSGLPALPAPGGGVPIDFARMRELRRQAAVHRGDAR